MEEEAAGAIVIGAGIVGASIAWRLAQRGCQVTLIDAREMGGEASWAGAGMLAPGGEVTEASSWSDLALESLRLYPEFIEDLCDESGCEIDYRRQGAIEVARNEAEWAALLARAERQRPLGVPSEPLPGNEIRRHVLLRLAPICGALFYPQDSIVDPRHVMDALRAACGARAVRILENLQVTAIHSTGRSVTVETRSGCLKAPVGILAAGAWSGNIPFHFEGRSRELPRSFPVRGHLIGYQLPAGTCRPILRHGHTYILQRSGGFTIAGSSVEDVGFDRSVNEKVVLDIRERAESLLPGLRAAGQPEAWLGFRPAVDRSLPYLGRFERSSLLLAYGHYRNGILMAPASARRICSEVMATVETR